MFQIGASLREARTRRGLSPADVQRAIRIRNATSLRSRRRMGTSCRARPTRRASSARTPSSSASTGISTSTSGTAASGTRTRLRRPSRRPASAVFTPLRPVLAGLAIAVCRRSPERQPGGLGRTERRLRTQTTGPGTTAAPSAERKPPAAASPAAPAYAVFRAARGSCWLFVRSSGPAAPSPLPAGPWPRDHAPAAVGPRPLGAHRRAVEPRPQHRRQGRHATAGARPTCSSPRAGVAAA